MLFQRRARAETPTAAASTAKTTSIRRYVGWIMVSALLPMGLFTVALLYFLWNTQQSHRNDEQIGRARALASVVESELRSTVARLEMLATDPMLTDRSLEQFHARSLLLLARSHDWLSVVLLAPDSQLVNTAVPFGTDLPPSQETPFLREAFSTAKPTVSDLIAARLLKTKTVAVSVPVVRDGTVRYVLVAALNLDYLSQTLARVVPQPGLATVLDRNFNIVARARDGDTYIGQLPGMRLLHAMQKQQEGITRSTTRDGTDSFTAFTRLDNGWSIGVATPSQELDQALARYLGVLVSVWLGVLLLGLALARLLLSRIDRSVASTVDAANALAAGHAVALPPSPIRELAALSDALSSLFLRERAARAEEESANRTKDEFLAMLGHELRNPLAPITTALHLMKLRGGEAFLKERGIIERQVQHMVRLIDDLLDVARITRGTVEIRRELLEISAIVAKAVETAAPLLEQRRIQLRVDVVPHGLPVLGDPTRLSQVLSNLVTNAAKFTAAGGHITVSGQARGDSIEITVADDGIGMDADELARVFELFTQGRQSVDRPHGGLGLGLAIARSLAVLHGGTLTATSAGRDQGSIFRLTLPSASDLPTQPAELVAERVDGAGHGHGLVLVVDDNVDAALVLRDLLEHRGYRVTVAHDGAQALDEIRARRFDVAVLDIGLPGMDGYELAQQIRREPHGDAVRLIALTGYGQESDRERAQAAGFDKHLVKPVDVQLLAQAMQGASNTDSTDDSI